MPQVPVDGEEFERWRAEADRALMAARVQADADLHNWACFAAEQAAQLAAKAFLHGLGRGPWGHDLVRLGELVRGAHVDVPPDDSTPCAGSGATTYPHGIPTPMRPPGPLRTTGPPTRWKRSETPSAPAVPRFGPGAPSVGAHARRARSRERERLLDLARAYAEGLSSRVSLLAAVAVGSVARGDFNVWSDVDVVVVAETLPQRAPDRSLLLAQDAPGRVQAVGFTPEELTAALRRGNPLAVDALAAGVVLLGRGYLAALLTAEEILDRVASHQPVGGRTAADVIREERARRGDHGDRSPR